MPLIDTLRQRLADSIRPRETAKITAVARTLTRDEKRHRAGGRLRVGHAPEHETDARQAIRQEFVISLHD
jgi:hypothetical protein